jgi:RNA polymerase sigma factor (sigma-70 family)
MNDDPDAGLSEPSAELLAILDSDPVVAEARFRELQRDLRRFLEWIGCVEPEEGAQEALVRGLRRLAGGVDTTKAGPRAFFFGIAKNIAYEGWKSRRREQQLDPDIGHRAPATSRGHQQVEARLTLQSVLRRLNAREREIILRYCRETNHDAHCRELDVTPGNLRIIVHRIREKIRKLAHG